MTSLLPDSREALDRMLLGAHRGGRHDRAVGFRNRGEARGPMSRKR
jgi:hypothetical protein